MLCIIYQGVSSQTYKQHMDKCDILYLSMMYVIVCPKQKYLARGSNTYDAMSPSGGHQGTLYVHQGYCLKTV